MILRYLLLTAITVAFAQSASAHQAFTLVSREKVSVNAAQLADLEKRATVGVVSGSNLTFTGADLKLVFTAGPEDDMLSYRVQGIRNPNIITTGDVRITAWFVNTDGDMTHDLLFSHYMSDFGTAPDVAESAGTSRLAPHGESPAFSAEKIVITSNEDGAYKYFCSVRGHAKGGMWGNIFVGVAPSGSPLPVDGSMPGMDMSPRPAPTATPHQHNAPQTTASPAPSPPPHDMSSMKEVNMSGMDMGDHAMAMPSTVNIGDPMARESSGTAWNPDSSPVFARMKMRNDGSMWMFMGTGFLRYTRVGSDRDVSVAGRGGRDKLDAPTMFMAMYAKSLTPKTQFGFRTMLSLDPVVERGFGYPLLYQSGEVYRGQPIHDRQHPHDLVSELAVTFSHKFDGRRSVYIYAGYPGEPALGPPMYLHRTSGMNIPDAPIGHHWQDATHITFGVVTIGYSFGRAKLEASAFNGTEPNENRWNFDRPRLNSFSGRFSFNPTRNWSLQISHGYLKDPEPSEPEVRILRRTTASAIYNKKLGNESNFAGTFIWGQNYASGERTNSVLFEGNYDFFKNAVFGRFETVQKNGHDLVLPSALHDDIFRLNTFSLGYVRDVARTKGLDIGLGGMLTANFNPSTLTPFYGGTSHAGWQLFMRVRPSRLH